MKRVYCICEGQTEENFVKQVLSHLSRYKVFIIPIVVHLSRDKRNKGGGWHYHPYKRDLVNLINQEGRRNDVFFTTMIDYYHLPTDFPGQQDVGKKPDADTKIEHLESSFKNDVNHPRFKPYLQKHEYEALLLAKPSCLKSSFPGNHREVEKLIESLPESPPEDINDGMHTHPAQRIIDFLPAYEKAKVRAGVTAAQHIGLSVLREKCPHFGQWLTWLENPQEIP